MDCDGCFWDILKGVCVIDIFDRIVKNNKKDRNNDVSKAIRIDRGCV